MGSPNMTWSPPQPAQQPVLPPAAFGAIHPASAAQGDTIVADITGIKTSFDSTSQVTFSGSGITASGITASDATHLTATLVIDPAADIAKSDVTVTTGSETVTGAGVFEVIASLEKAEILREAVNTYLRQNHIPDHAQDICVEFIAAINQTMRDQVAGKSKTVVITVWGGQ